MPVTSKKIAELSGVSRGTVDRVLHQRGNVRPEVERRVKEIAERLGYVPNRAGKALSSRNRPVRIGILLQSVGNPFFDKIKEGIAAAKQEYSDFTIDSELVELKGYHISEQLAQIDRLVEKQVQLLILTPINSPEISEKIDGLSKKGISVITLNSDIEHAGRLCYVGCHYIRSGETAAGLMGLMLKEGNVGIVTGSVKMLGHNQRISGFLSVCKKEYPGLKVIDIAENNDDDTQSEQAVFEMLKCYPEISALYFTAGGVTGGIRAIELLGRDDILVITCDNTLQIQRYLQAGRISATVSQKPFRQGYEAMKAALEYLINQKPLSTEIYMDNEIIIKQNM